MRKNQEIILPFRAMFWSNMPKLWPKAWSPCTKYSQFSFYTSHSSYYKKWVTPNNP